MKDEPTSAEKSARVMIRQGYGRSALVGDINIECRPDPKHLAIGAGPNRRLPPPGSYAVQFSSYRVTPFKTDRTRGVLCFVRIARGKDLGILSSATWAFWRNGAGLLEPTRPQIPPA